MSQLRVVDSIVFLTGEAATLPRGWDPRDVAGLLPTFGLSVSIVNLSLIDRHDYLSQPHSKAIFWPTTYIISADSPTTIFALLEEYQLEFFGCSSRAHKLTSKLRLKSAMLSAGLSTVPFTIVKNSLDLQGMEAPYFLKTEYTSDSRGVRLVDNSKGIDDAIGELGARREGELFAEAKAEGHEYTASAIRYGGRHIIASMALAPLVGAYVDQRAKADNLLVHFAEVPRTVALQIRHYVGRFAHVLQLQGHFRLDLFVNSAGLVLPIDLNFHPHLSADPLTLSYLPMTFSFSYGLSYDETIALMIDGAFSSMGRTFAATKCYTDCLRSAKRKIDENH